MIEIGRGSELDQSIRLMIGIGFDRLDSPDGKAARINLISSGGKNLFAGLDAGVRGQVVDHNLTCSAAAKNRAKTSGGKNDAGA